MMENAKSKLWSRIGSAGFAGILCLGAACATAKAQPGNAPAQVGSAGFSDARSTPLASGLSTPHADDGSILLATIVLPPGADPASLAGQYEDITLDFYPLESQAGAFQSVVPVPFNHAPGPTQVKIHFKLDGKEQTLKFPLEVTPGQYKSEQLKNVNPEKLDEQTPADLKRIAEEQKVLDAIYDRVTPHKYWKGPFLLPLDSLTTSPFGTKRIYNGHMKSFHKGLDFRAKVGTEIHASAAGKVALARELFFSGNTVIIDHGYGIFTFYFHMSKFAVKEGEEVQAGQALGLSGATGRVTGPHLHWQAAYHKLKFNPIYLTKVMQ